MKPADDYDSLLKQYNALRLLLDSKEKVLSYYMTKDYSVSEERLQALEESLESERKMNEILTKELEELKMSIRYIYRDVYIVKDTESDTIHKIFGVKAEADSYVEEVEANRQLIIDTWPVEFKEES